MATITFSLAELKRNRVAINYQVDDGAGVVRSGRAELSDQSPEVSFDFPPIVYSDPANVQTPPVVNVEGAAYRDSLVASLLEFLDETLEELTVGQLEQVQDNIDADKSNKQKKKDRVDAVHRRVEGMGVGNTVNVLRMVRSLRNS